MLPNQKRLSTINTRGVFWTP